MLVGGEAGVGKTSLVRRFCDELPGGTAVFWGGCDPLMTPRPLGPFLEIAEHARGAIDGVLDPWSARTRRRRRAARAPATTGRRSSSSSRTRTGRTRARWTCCGCSGRRNAATRVSRARHLPRRPARPRPSAPHRSRRSRDRGLGRAARGPAPLPRRRRTARRGRRRRRRNRLATHVGQPVLRRRAPRARRARGTRLGPRRRAGAGRAARPTGDCRRRGGGDRATLARRGSPARRVRRGDRRRRRVHRERRSPHRRAAASHSGTSSRARPSRSRCPLPGDSRCIARCCWR